LKTRAALFRELGRPLEVAEVELEEPGAGDVLLRTAAVGVCGSDLHVVRGEWPRPTPMILGHEGSGIVEAIGPEVEGIRPGDRAVISWAPSCGSCGPCRRGRTTACLPLREAIGKGTLPDGSTRLRYGGETVYRMTTVGALAERVLIPASAVLPLPESVPLDQAALLGCAALTGVGAVVNAAPVEPGSAVVVIGAGGVGQFVVQAARLARASAIVAIDPLETRRAQALRLGATAAVGPGEAAGLVAELTEDGADAVFEAVGSPATQALAVELIRPGGVACLVGLPAAGARLDLDPFDLVNREKTVTGSIYGSEDPHAALPALLAHVAAGRIELEGMLGPSFQLDQVNDAIEASLAGTAGRVLVRMEG
jgi:S-(hydroxymethyl)glutathione dehydrogenase/alcohol dehydrogenase